MAEKEDFYTSLNNRYYNIYSTGGEAERSRNKRLGDIYNKDYEKMNPCYKIYEEIMEKVTNLYLKR